MSLETVVRASRGNLPFRREFCNAATCNDHVSSSSSSSLTVVWKGSLLLSSFRGESESWNLLHAFTVYNSNATVRFYEVVLLFSVVFPAFPADVFR